MNAEIGIRWLVAGAAAFLAGWTGVVPFGLAVGVAAAWAAGSTLAIHFKDRNNPGIAGYLATWDGLAWCILASAASRLGSVGWFAALPGVHAVIRYGTRPLATSALTSGAMLAVHFALRGSHAPAMVLLQACGILALGFALRPAYGPETLTESIGSVDPMAETEADGMLGLRESFRKLKTMYRNLEWQTRRDTLCARLLETRIGDAKFIDRLTERVRDLTGADSAVLYVVDSNALYPGAASQEALPDRGLKVDPNLAVGRVRHAAEQELASAIVASGAAVVNVPIAHEGKVVGLFALGTHAERAEDVRRAADDLAPWVGSLILEAQERGREQRSLKALEARSALALCLRGNSSDADLASRLAGQLHEIYGLDHVSIWHGGEPLAIAGRDLPTMPALGDGDLFAPACYDDRRFESTEILKSRIGTLAAFTHGPFRFVLSSSREAAIDAAEFELIREICNDLVWHTSEPTDLPSGLVDSEAFRSRMQVAGTLVMFEIQEREIRSKSELGLTQSTLRSRVLGLLPAGAAALVRPDGDVLVHLPQAKIGGGLDWGSRILQHLQGVRIKTASLWPRANAVIHTRISEPDEQAALSNR